MDIEPESIPAPKKRAPRKTSTTVRKPRAKKIADEIPPSFSASPEKVAIACEYSDLIRDVAVEDWSPTQEKPAATSNHRAKISREKTTTMLEISADPAAEGLPRGVGDDRRYQKDSRGDGESLFPENKPGEELRKENGRPNATYREGYRSQRNELPYNGAGRSEHTYPHREGSGNRRNENPRDHNLRNGTFQRSDSRGPQRNFQQNAYANRRRPAPTIRIGAFSIGYLRGLEYLISRSQIDGFCGRVVDFNQSPLYLNEVLDKSNDDLADFASSIDLDEASSRAKIIDNCMESALAEGRPIVVKGILESMEGGDGIITYACDSYKIRAKSTFVPRCLIQSLGLRRGQTLSAFVHPPMEQSTCPFAIKISDVLGKLPEEAIKFPRFKDLTPYYPTERIFLENKGASANDSLSMRIIDLLSPIGFGQRGLIVAPPKTGKTVLLQGMANAIIHNQPGTKLVVLLIDERPEEVTDFLRQVRGAEVISSTFDESAESHIHAAEIVIESARRWVEAGENVVILLDSITRLARAYNTEQPSSGKILSGGVEANALQLPKRFFGSARNIEGGGSLTIIATALIETGSRMDDVIFEEFKGTGNMELHLDRAISDRRIFPAINLERSGTRKEELLYHPDELAKIYNLRRAFQDISGGEAMEMLVSRLKRCANNVEFLMHMNR